MKTFAVLAALAATISSVSAQSAVAQANANVNVNVNANAVAVAGGSAPVVTAAPVAAPVVPAYYPGCVITSTYPGISTITATTTSTYCPVCNYAIANNLPYTTTYVTVLVAVCPTGYSSATYTITAVATGSTPLPVVPVGYVTTALVCTACPGQPTVTVTIPAGAATGVAGSTAKTSNTVLFTAAGVSLQLKGFGATLVAAGASVFLGMIFL